MSVLVETHAGDITIDLYVEEAPKTCENFLKLCKIKYYNYAPVHTIRKGRFLQTGDPLGPTSKDSDGGTSIWGVLGGAPSRRRRFSPEFNPQLKHKRRGTVSMVTSPASFDKDRREAASQFIITLGEDLDQFDGVAAIFGYVSEGLEVLDRIGDMWVDDDGRPLRDIRILHTHILDEANVPDPPGLVVPATSPVPSAAQLATERIAYEERFDEEVDQEALEKVRRQREARQQALTLEMVGDLPFAEVAPPENVLFVCKLNPVTRDDDLELIFSRFGKILSCEVIRDKRTGDSLQYAFIEFAQREDCERAYFKMQSVLIDDHRIHVDFSQSVSRLADAWRSNESRKRAGGSVQGFGGIKGLQKKRQFKDDVGKYEAAAGGDYDMVFDERDAKRGRDNSPEGHRERDSRNGKGRSRSPRRRRSYSRSPPRRERDRGRRGMDNRRHSRERDHARHGHDDHGRDHRRR